jgi:hypothetical protein
MSARRAGIAQTLSPSIFSETLCPHGSGAILQLRARLFRFSNGSTNIAGKKIEYFFQVFYKPTSTPPAEI